MVKFIKEHTIHRFRILKSITTNQGTIFIGDEVKARDQNATPYYTQMNGQEKAANKVMVRILSKIIIGNLRG